MAAQLGQRVLAGAHPQHAVAGALQVGAHERADVGLVLDDHDRRRPWRHRRCALAAAPSARVLHAADLRLTGGFQPAATVSSTDQQANRHKRGSPHMSLIRKHSRLLAGGGLLPRRRRRGERDRQRRRRRQAGAPGGRKSAKTTRRARRGGGLRGSTRRAVHGEFVVHTKTGFATVTFDRGIVDSVSGQQLTITEGTRKATLQDGDADDPGRRPRPRRPPEGDACRRVKPGSACSSCRRPKRTFVIARTHALRRRRRRVRVAAALAPARGLKAVGVVRPRSRRPSTRERAERRRQCRRSRTRESARRCDARGRGSRTSRSSAARARAQCSTSSRSGPRCG